MAALATTRSAELDHRPAAHDRFGRTLRWIARIWAEAAIIIYLLTQASVPSPIRGDGGYWERLASLAVIAIIAIGHVISWRWEIQGATVMAVGGAVLALLTAFRADSFETVPTEGRGITEAQVVLFAFAVPAFLYWLLWRRDRDHRSVIALATVFAVLVGVTGAVTFVALRTAYGSFTPTSAAPIPDTATVEWLWAGPPTSTETAVAARVTETTGEVSLVVSPSPDLADGRTYPGNRASDDPQAVRFQVDGLTPDTRYYYAVAVGDEIASGRTGTLRTVAQGPTDLLIGVGSCIQTGSNSVVFDSIVEAAPDLFVVTGDFAYTDFWTDDRDAVRAMYSTQLMSPAIAAMTARVPVAYVWDDHDFGPNDADSTAKAGPAGEVVYRQSVPYLELPAGPGPAAIYQSFTLGRVRVILTDGRSQRSPKASPDDANKTMLGEPQLQWLAGELAAAKEDGQFIILVTNVPWNGDAQEGADDWAGYTTERRRIADLISDTGVADQLLMVAGDAHMVAIDDGSHTDFSTSGAGGFPLIQAAALDRPGSVKAGPYSEGYHAGAGQFGLIDITDDGDQIEVALLGTDYEGAELVSYSFTVSPDDLAR